MMTVKKQGHKISALIVHNTTLDRSQRYVPKRVPPLPQGSVVMSQVQAVRVLHQRPNLATTVLVSVASRAVPQLLRGGSSKFQWPQDEIVHTFSGTLT